MPGVPGRLCISTLFLCSSALFCLSRGLAQEPVALPRSPQAFAGDQACIACHQKEASAWPANPHHLDSAPADAKTILGDFTPGKNVVHTAIPGVIFAMIASNGGFFQTAINLDHPDDLHGIAQPFDIVIGSGRRGQTYLYWKGDQLFELPISYWTYDREWINSPGYPPDQVHFNRPIIPRCLECHTTSFRANDPESQDSNAFARSSLILGIGCEKCHGPGALHVARERSAHPPPAGSPEIAVVNPARLAHDRKMDLCSLCHAGVGQPLRPALSYRPGDVLADDIALTAPPPGTPIDVHGNQVSALERSKCYSSGRLACSTCHNVHERQENVDSYSAHCLGCHTVEACRRFKVLGEAIRTKCVECHMPEGKSQGLHSTTEGHFLQAELRTHLIAIYPGVTLARHSAHGTAR